jgi:hypothetical protein
MVQDKWVQEYKTPYPVKEHQVGDGNGIYLNSIIAYSYFKDIERLFPELRTDDGRTYILFHSACPKNYCGRAYKIYKLKRGNRFCFYLPIPKHLRAAVVQGKRKVMYDFTVFLDENAANVIQVELYGGR